MSQVEGGVVSQDAKGTTCLCSECGTVIESCEACGDEPCPEAVCFWCLNLSVGQVVPDPHTHGG